MNEHRHHDLSLVVMTAVILLVLAGLCFWYLSPTAVRPVEEVAQSLAPDADKTDRQPPLDGTGDGTPLRSDRETQLKNTRQTVAFPFAQYDQLPDGYVGTAACASCHSDRHQSYLRTHHSRSLRELDMAEEDHGETLVHRLSKRSYDVVAKDDGLWHRQWIHYGDAADDKMPIGELPVSYVMGSGAFAKAYLLADGDYLLQSPVTWYAGSDQLEMAPGYDQANHYGFTRVISAKCMFCHAGLVSLRDDNPQHLAIHELSIGCERCHGPGEAHTKLYREIQSGAIDSSLGVIDSRIVNPAKLDRRQAESICSQCHLHGDVVVHPPGEQVTDFVVGEDLAKTRLHYKHDKTGELNSAFTGHFDQMWQSKCYRQSETLTCVTCHDPHQAEGSVNLVNLRRRQCNRCHADDQSCGLPLDQRIEQADDNCIECHMPSIATGVPHTSSTSHLIAIYDSGEPRGIPATETEEIRRLEVSPALPEPLLTRADTVAEALWDIELARQEEFEPLKSRDIDAKLQLVLRDAPQDADAHSLLARMNRLRADWMATSPTDAERVDPVEAWEKVVHHATKTLELEKRPVESRETALDALASQQMESDDYAAAAASFTELTQTRREAIDWYNLGLCFGKLQRYAEAEQAFREAIRLNGAYAAPYRSLSILYRSINPTASRQCENMARRLMSQ